MLRTSSKRLFLGATVAVGVTLTGANKLCNFTPDAANSRPAIDGLLFIFCFAPAAALTLTYLPLYRYPLTEESIRKLDAL